jgi:hypothetical protein
MPRYCLRHFAMSLIMPDAAASDVTLIRERRYRHFRLFRR